MRLALDAEDSPAALAAGGKALDLKPQSALVAKQLLQLHADQRNWTAALAVITIVIKGRKKQIGTVPELLSAAHYIIISRWAGSVGNRR